MISIPDCKRFTGYKPCEPYKNCLDCSERIPFGTRILIINLDALGDVLVTTATLAAIKRKYPTSTIHWLTKANAEPLLINNPLLDKIWIWNEDSRLILAEMEFDILFNADKNQNSCAFVNCVSALVKYGFGLNRNGAIIPLNQAAEYNYRMGLEDLLKFKTNRRSGQDILAETFEVPYQHDEYVLALTRSEQIEVDLLRRNYGIGKDDFAIGLNTGCSSKFPNKKLTVAQDIELAKRIKQRLPLVKILLLGGKEDRDRNAEIAATVDDLATSTPTDEGLRRGILYEAICDLIVSGDSLGMHIGIALKKYVLAWFGMTSHAEIDLYDRGEKIISDVPCSPCWSPVCLTGTLECIQQLNLDDFVNIVEQTYKMWLKQKGLSED